MLRKLMLKLLGLGDLVSEVESLRADLDAFKENIEEYNLDQIEEISEKADETESSLEYFKDEIDEEFDTYIKNSSEFEDRIEELVADYLKHNTKKKK